MKSWAFTKDGLKYNVKRLKFLENLKKFDATGTAFLLSDWYLLPLSVIQAFLNHLCVKNIE